MKITRSTKCSIKFATRAKQRELSNILVEYSRVVNTFIDHFWVNPVPKVKLLKPVVDIPDTWLSARLRKVAAREAIDMISAAKERWRNKPNKLSKPKHRGTRMCVSSTIGALDEPKTAYSFDGWFHMSSIGKNVILDIPVKFHKHYNKLKAVGKRLNSYIITPNYIQFVFEVETGAKKQGKKCIGIDTGINALASLSTGEQLGTDIKSYIERVKRCQQGSKGQSRARRALKQRINEVAKQVMQRNPDLVVVECLKGLGKNSKLKRRLSKNIRRSIGSWNWKYWLGRLKQQCEWNRVSFRTVSPYNTSITCPACGHTDKENRDGELFSCRKCGHTGNADLIASSNILSRFLTGPYGAGYETKIT